MISSLNKEKELHHLYISKYNINKNYDIFTQLFDTCVSPVFLYAGETCGFNNFRKYDQIQNKAMRFFLDIHKYALMLGFQCDLEWAPLSLDRYVSAT